MRRVVICSHQRLQWRDRRIRFAWACVQYLGLRGDRL